MNLVQLLSNPVKLQIMQAIQERGTATTKQISEQLRGVSIPTLYRHVYDMLEAGYLTVVKENRVRGSLERVLAISTDMLVQTEHGEVAQSAYQFLMGLFMQFQCYSEQPEIDPIRDMLMMRTCLLRLTDERFTQLLTEWAALIEKYRSFEDEPSAKARNLTMISAPIEP